MKKIISIFAVTLFCFSCNNEKTSNATTATSDAAKKNLDASNTIVKAIESGDVSKLGDYIAADAVDHSSETGKDVIGVDSIKASMVKMHDMYSDMKFDVIKELSDDDYTFQWVQFTGTCKVPSMGMPAGTKMDMSSLEVTKFKDGKATEHWSFVQPAEMMKMMPSGAGMDKMMEEHKMDTTKKM